MEPRVTRSAKNVALTEGISNPPRKSGKKKPADDADAQPAPPRPKPRPKEKAAPTVAVMESNDNLVGDPFNLSGRVALHIRRTDALLKSSQRLLDEVATEEQDVLLAAADSSLKSSQRVLNKIDAEEQKELRLLDESTGEDEEEFDFDFDDRDTQSYNELTTPFAKHGQSADAHSPTIHTALGGRSVSSSQGGHQQRERQDAPCQPCSQLQPSCGEPLTFSLSCSAQQNPSWLQPSFEDAPSFPSQSPSPACSLPPLSPPAHLESEFEDSEDDYEATQAKIQKILDKQAAHGRPMPPTVEEEDLEDLDDFEKEAAGARKKPRVTEDEEAADGDDDNESHKTGPVLAAIKERLAAAHESFLAEVAALAKECGKSPNTLHQLVGSVIKTTRASSPWNIYQQWHAKMHPKATEMSTKDYNTLARNSFKTACALPEDELNDPHAVYTAIPWLKEWHNKLMTNVTLQWRNNGKFKAKVQKGMQPIVQQCRVMYNSFGVHVWGFRYRTEYKLSLTQTIKDWEHIIGMMNLKRRGGLDSELGQTVVGLMMGDVERKEGEAARDMFRCVLGSILSHQLEVFGVARGIGPKLLDFLFKARCRVVNYPPALEDVGQQMGGSFNLKKVSLVTYKAFVPVMQKANQQMQEGKEPGEDMMGIVSWDAAEMAQSLKDQRDIVLVTAVDRRTLVSVKHSAVYDISVADEFKATAPRGKRGPCAGSRSRLASHPPSHFRSRSHSRSCLASCPPSHFRSQSHSRSRLAPILPTPSPTPVVNHIAATAVLAPVPPTPSPTPVVNHIAAAAVPDLHAGTMPPTLWDMEHLRALVLVVDVITGMSMRTEDVLTLGTVTRPSSRLVEDMVYPPARGAPLERHYSRRPPSPPARGGAFTKNLLGRSLSPTPHAGSSQAGHSEVHCPHEEVHDEQLHQSSVKHKREIGDAEGKSAIKRQREENSDAAAPLYKCRFNVKELTLVFYAKGFHHTERNTRANRATIICREGQEYRRLQVGLTLILVLSLDTERYYKEIVTHRLEG
ncbi:hypothetical protein DFH09DRAFT_1313205 [Mycena vulgaris]|nr:hypothetical protein DFH09DRAFT_1313205 [Mycena vulgaris]